MNNANNSTVEEQSNPMMTFRHDDLTVTVMVVKPEEGPILTELPFLLNAIGVERGEREKYGLVNLAVGSRIRVHVDGAYFLYPDCPGTMMSAMRFAILLAILVYPKIKDWDDPVPFSSAPKLKWFQTIAEEYYSLNRSESGMHDAIRWVSYLDFDKMVDDWSSIDPSPMPPVTPTIQSETKKEKDELHEGLSDTPQDTQATSGTVTDIPASVEKGLTYTAEQVEHIIKTILQSKGIAG